jgi:phosphopantothenoylcysteine decarboxylase/phosphopantothenate--cysteine ligase
MPAEKKTVVLGVTGSIAAYKAADLCGKLVRGNFNTVVVMTASARKLVTEQTFFTLSQNPVITDLWEIPDWRPGHIALSEKADVLAVAPCTANFIGKLANGIADDALSTFALSHTGKILLAPAMNPGMWANRAVRDNCAKLKERGVVFVGPAEGAVACGEAGTGRMEEPITILQEIRKYA